MGNFEYPDYNLGNFADELDLNWGDFAFGDDPSLDPGDVAWGYLFRDDDPREDLERELEEWLERAAEGGSL